MIRVRPLVALALLALAGPARASTDASGALSFGYARSDTWSQGVHDKVPSWAFAANLSLSGQPLRPGLLQWSAAGSYSTFRTMYSESTSRGYGFGYAAALSVFNDSPVSIALTSARTWTEFTVDAATITTGSTVIGTEGGTVTMRLPDAPTLTASVNRTETDNHGLGGAHTTGSNVALHAGAAQSLGNHAYSLTYDTNWSEGSYAVDNYRSHYFSMQETSRLSEAVEVRVADQYFLRDPTRDVLLNPRFDDNSLAASLSWRTGGWLNREDYNYRHTLVTAPGADARESLLNAVRHTSEYHPSASLTWLGSLGATFARGRLGDASLNGATQDLTGGVRWTRRSGRWDYGLEGGAGLSVVERDPGISDLGYSLTAGASAGTSGDRWYGTATYSGSFAKGGLTLGSTLRQQINVLVEGWPQGGPRLRGQLTLAGSRLEDRLYGVSLNRTVNLNLESRWRAYTLQLGAGLADGLSPSLTSPIADGLFLPGAYDTHSRFVTLIGTADVARAFTLSGLARYLRTSGPGRPVQNETGFGLKAGYAIGAFTLSLEDRLSVGGYGAIRQTVNLFLFRITRTFGARF